MHDAPETEICENIFETGEWISLFNVFDWYFKNDTAKCVRFLQAKLHAGHFDVAGPGVGDAVVPEWQVRQVLQRIADNDAPKDLGIRATESGYKWWRSYMSGES